MQIGIGILLEEEGYNYARSLELNISRLFHTKDGLRQPPHITIKAPFEVESLEPFESYFDDLAKSIRPFEIEISGIGSFKPNVIYLKVTPNPELLNLHLKIINELQERYQVKKSQFEGEKIVFHSTLAMSDISEDNFHNAIKFLSSEDKKIKFTFSTLGLFYLLGDKDWIVTRISKVG